MRLKPAMRPEEMIKILGARHKLATQVLIDLHNAASGIDPTYDMTHGATGVLVDLDKLGLYGADVWKFFSWLCGKDFRHCVGVLKAYRLGILTKKEIQAGIVQKGNGWDFDKLIRTVQTKNPDFDSESQLRAKMNQATEAGLAAPEQVEVATGLAPKKEIPLEEMKKANKR